MQRPSGLPFCCLVLCLLAPAAHAAGTRFLTKHVPPAVAGAQSLGPMSRTARLDLAIGLPLRNQETLDRLLQELADPSSPNYRQYLTPDQFTAQFGPSESDYDAVTAFAESHGLKVRTTHPNRMILDVTGTVADIENAFAIHLMAWRDSARGSFFAPDREPSVDADLPILDITGLDNYTVPKPMNLKTASLPDLSSFGSPFTSTGSGPAGLLIGSDFRHAYAPGVKLTGAGQTIGLFELDGFYASDLQANFSAADLTPVPVQTVLIDGVNGSAGNGNTEVMLDIMMAAYMAPGAEKIIVYEGNNWNDVFNRMATDNQASQLSSSWGFSAINATTDQIFRQMIAQGQCLFQASGDGGVYVGGVMPPSDNPNLTVVGGTHLNTSGAGGAWFSESAWSGSGGGISNTYSIPSYQQGVNFAAAGGSTIMRNIPDVALTADVQMFLIQSNGQAVSVGGTSAAAPLWAGFLALVNQQAAANGTRPVGFINPAIYAIGAGSNYKSAFHDITSGSNGLPTVTGFDLVTGWGTPAGQPLIDQLTTPQGAPSFTLSGSTASISIVPGQVSTTIIGVTPQNGFSGVVALSVSGLPTGVTGSFGAPTTGGSSTLTLTAAVSAVAGTATVTVTGKSTSTTATYTLAVTVTPPSGFTISANPGNLGVTQGGSGKTTITALALNGFSGALTLSTSPLPAGVTAVFARGAAAGSSTLTINASASAATGTQPLTITGTSGNLTSSATLNLTITAVPSFSLAPASASLSMIQGGSVSDLMAINPLNGFSGTVVLSVSGLPAGVTSTFSGDTLILSAAASAVSGSTAITVTGTSGTLIRTATILLNIAGPASFTMTASPLSLSLTQGSSASTAIQLAAQNSFTGKVVLAVSGLPYGVTALFSTPAASTTSTLTLSATVVAATGLHLITVTGASGSIVKTAIIALTVLPAADFSLALSSGNLSILPGSGGADLIRITSLSGFTGNVVLSASGLPAGVTASFTPAATVGVYAVTLNVASSSSATGTSAITITGTAGVLVHTARLSLTILVPSPAITPVNLSSVSNVSGLALDGVPFSTGGLDTGGRAYSGLLLGATKTVGGVSFSLAPMNGPSAVSSKTIALPAGTYSSLKILATAANGNQPSQVFTINYTDGTKSTYTQSLSDWYTPQNYPGETTAVNMPYRDNSTGTLDGRTFVLYEYSFSLTPGKTVSSLVLPNNRGVVALAATLTKN